MNRQMLSLIDIRPPFLYHRFFCAENQDLPDFFLTKPEKIHPRSALGVV
jgi:hypothetical protein